MVSFYGGGVMGFAVASFGLLALTKIFTYLVIILILLRYLPVLVLVQV
jgi:hypothetical protein